MKRLLVFMVLAGLFLTGGIYTTRMIKEKSITGLTNTEMREIYAGVTCGNTYPCKEAGGYCRHGCTNIGGYCERCVGPGMHYICSNRGPSGSSCTPGVIKEGCGQAYWGECKEIGTLGTCTNKGYLSSWCDMQNATGTSCPVPVE